MAKKDYTGKAEEVLPAIIDEQVKLSLGSVKFSKKDKKAEAKIYLRNGRIYGIELSTYKPNIVNRIITNEYVQDNARELILQKYGNNLSDMTVLQFVLGSQLFPEKPLMFYIKDYFLDAFDEVLAWDQIAAEVKIGEEPTTPTVPDTNPFDLIEKIKNRRQYLESQVSPVWNSTMKQMEQLGFRRNFKFDTSDYTTMVLLSVADGNWTIGAAAEYLGMSRFNVKKILFELWQEGVIDVIHPSGLLITNRTQESIRSGVKIHNGGKYLGQNRELELMPGDSLDSLPSPPAPSVVVASQPVSFSEPQARPSEPLQQTVASQPVQIAPQQVAPVPSNPQPEQSINQIPTIRKEEMSDPTQASSRLALIAQQLREELANVEKGIQAAMDRKTTLVQYHSSLTQEKEALLAQLQSVETRLTTNQTDIGLVDAEINRLVAEKNETTKMLQG